MSAARPWDGYQFQFFYVPDKAVCLPAMKAFKELEGSVQSQIAAVNLRKIPKAIWPAITGVPYVQETFGVGKATKTMRTVVKAYAGEKEVMKWFQTVEKRTYSNVGGGVRGRVSSTTDEHQFFGDHTADIEDMSDDVVTTAMLSGGKITQDQASSMIQSMVLEKPPPPPDDVDVLAEPAEVDFIVSTLNSGPEAGSKPPRVSEEVEPSYSTGQVSRMIDMLKNEGV